MSSRFLSLVLRHRPETIGLALDPAGWADVDALLEKANAYGKAMSRADLEQIVAENDKKRFTLSACGARIRAAHGHSVEVDLGLAPTTPPDLLFHGTAMKSLAAIWAEGLSPRARRHVHLSGDVETARAVGRRHGAPVVLRVDAAAMAAEGRVFWRSASEVWLTDAVAPGYLTEHAETP